MYLTCIIKLPLPPHRALPKPPLLHMKAYLLMSYAEWEEVSVGESMFHEDSKDVLTSTRFRNGTL